MKKIKFLSITAIILSYATIAYARLGNGQDYVPVSTGGSSSSGGSFISGGGSIFSVIIFIAIIYGISWFLKKKGISTNAKNPLTGNNPLSNSSVQRDLMRGNVSGALFDAAIGGAIGSIFGKMGTPNIGGFGMGGQGVGFGANNLEAELAKIKASDPQFNEQVFKDKAETAFYKLQEGWKRQDLSIMRPFVSDSILSRFTNQLSDLKSRGEKNIVEDMTIGHTDITNMRSDANFNYITVKIDASAIDYTVNSQDQIIRGDKNAKGFSEYWTLLRSVGVKTNPDKQLKDNKCPNCGAALQVNATGKCEYCGAVITSGQFDWVLSEIKQS